ncbi:tetratricopeptide repeat protein [Croceiramulus getboli]|nr:tetratricopeptide repeat protein [Flavobacteriaceae bacterium YJPT1-3]
MSRTRASFLLVFFLFTSLWAQQTAIFTNDLVRFNKALELYNSKQYLASQTLFDEVLKSTNDQTIQGDCAYYIANAAVRLNQLGADRMMQEFVEDYPTSTKRNSAFKDVADYYFENGKYAYAKKWYDLVNENNLSGKELERYNFNVGYALFKSRKGEEAKKYFNRVRDSKEYGSQAKYYIGFIAYDSDDYEEADELFEAAEEAGGVEREELAYFKADLNFKLGNFEEAIQLAKEQLPSANRLELSELNKIIGESYFNLGEYQAAIPYLKEYQGKRGKWNNTDYYQLGYAYYKQQDYEKAIAEFNKIIDGNNSVAQNAYYHLAESYLKTDRKQEALNAFRNAYEMDFSPQIQEDSGLNYVKLSYEIGNAYTPTPQAIAEYLERYPKTLARQELEDLLIDSYITSRNYAGAIELLENNRSFNNKLAYQKVTFYRGVELFNEGQYREAVSLFDKSLKEPRDAAFKARAHFWRAESLFNSGNYADALIAYKQFKNSEVSGLEESKMVDYNLGYAYFKQKDYNAAQQYFKAFTNQSGADLAVLKDAYLRLADSYFVTSNYRSALEAYNQAIARGGADTDYATFQKAISYGFIKQNAQKVEALKSFAANFPGSSYRDDALYELGNVLVATQNNEAAITAYDQLIQELPKSTYAPRALLKKALIYDNTGRSEQALNLFKRVAADYPNTQEALQAVASAKLIYIDLGRVDEYGNWVSGLDYVEIQDNELDDAAYASAEKPFVENNTGAAIRQFENYLRDYPNGKRALDAHFYLGQLYFAQAEKQKAIPHYAYVIAKSRTEFTEQALSRLGEIYLAEKQYQQAIPVLKRLENEAEYSQNIIFAQSNLMKATYELKQYEAAVSYAEKVLQNAKIDNTVKADAQVIIARSALQTGNESKAENAYAEVQKVATGALAAEALYYDAFFKNKSGAYKASNDAVQKLAKEYSAYKEYGAKGLVLMAKNFDALGDAYQATYILESVIQNFKAYPQVVEEAETELGRIKAKEAKTNASVEKTDD